MQKVCFMFGHGDTDASIRPLLNEAVERHYTEHNVRVFVVGHYGGFDRLAASVLAAAKGRHKDIRLLMLIPYHPAERPANIPPGFDDLFYPEGMENVPRRLAIVCANKKAVDIVDTVICCVRQFGNSRTLLEYARRRQEKGHLIIQNLYGK